MADDEPDPLTPGIVSSPEFDNGVIYFLYWPDTVYSFDEERNEGRWSTVLTPSPEDPDISLLPAPAPIAIKSYVLVHLGRHLYGVTKVDGRVAWSIDMLPPASRANQEAQSNTLPGYYILDDDPDPILVTLEEDDQWWYCRRRMLGDGSLVWERRLNGLPRGWWLDRDGLWISSEQFGESGPGPTSGRPATVSKLDIETGLPEWSTPVLDEVSFRATFRASPDRIFLLEEKWDGDFVVRGFNEETSELERTVTYSAGDFIAALASDQKLVFLHFEGSLGGNNTKFSLYHTSLSRIWDQTMWEARSDQHFRTPAIAGNMFLYGSTAYETYDGRIVWQKAEQVSIVDYTWDDYRFYFWDARGGVFSLDRLTGQELWRTTFDVMPGGEFYDSNFGGASLELVDNRLFACTPDGELARFNIEDGEIYPGIIKVSESEGEIRTYISDYEEPAQSRVLYVVLIIMSLLIILTAVFYFVGRKLHNSSGGANHGSGF